LRITRQYAHTTCDDERTTCERHNKPRSLERLSNIANYSNVSSNWDGHLSLWLRFSPL
jgi:hypothetical protein